MFLVSFSMPALASSLNQPPTLVEEKSEDKYKKLEEKKIKKKSEKTAKEVFEDKNETKPKTKPVKKKTTKMEKPKSLSYQEKKFQEEQKRKKALADEIQQRNNQRVGFQKNIKHIDTFRREINDNKSRGSF
jgi:hypothetical protein